MNEAADKIEEEDISLSDETSIAELEKEIPEMAEDTSEADADAFEMKDVAIEEDVLGEEEKNFPAEEDDDLAPLPELSPKEHSVEIKEIQKKEVAVEIPKNEPFEVVVKAVAPSAAATPTMITAPIDATAQVTAPVSLEVELTFVLGQQRLSLENFSLLAEEKIITLGGSDFQVKIMLQEKPVAEAQLKFSTAIWLLRNMI